MLQSKFDRYVVTIWPPEKDTRTAEERGSDVPQPETALAFYDPDVLLEWLSKEVESLEDPANARKKISIHGEKTLIDWS